MRLAIGYRPRWPLHRRGARAGAAPAPAPPPHRHQGARRRGQSPRPGGGDPRPGQEPPWARLQPPALSDDIRAIFALGFFDDVQPRVDDFEGGVRSTFVVVERPFVRDVDFVGNKVFGTTDAPGEDRHQARQRLQPGRGPAAGEKLQGLLRGRGLLRGPDHPRDREVRGRRRQGHLQRSTRGARSRSTASSSRGTRGSPPTSRSRRRWPPRSASSSSSAGRCSARSSRRTSSASSPSTTTTATSRRGWSRTTSRWTGSKARVTITIIVVEGPQFRVGELEAHRRHPAARSARSSASITPQARRRVLARPSFGTPSPASPTSTARSAAPRRTWRPAREHSRRPTRST